MKQIAAIIVFFSLMVLSLFLGYANYVTAKEHIIEDVNRALVKTVFEDKKVSIDDICRNLWPRKENAKESLYTLVRRLKPIVESNTNLKVVADKGGYYRLSIKNT